MTTGPTQSTVAQVSGRPSTADHGTPSARRERTCVGCGRLDASDSMVRLVVSNEGEIAADLAGSAFGRGAHVHPSPKCVAGAPRGLAKSFKRPIAVAPSDVAGLIADAAHRRAHGLLASAARAGKLVVGADLGGEAFEKGKAHLLVVARDAASAAAVGSVMHAIAKGGAVAWGTKLELGSLVKKTEVGVLGIASQPIAAAVRTAVTIANSVTEGSGPSREVYAGGDRRKAATED